MSKTISIELTNQSINSAIKEIRKYSAWVQKKETELRIRLAQLGMEVASIKFTGAMYDGTNDVSVRVDNTGSVAVIYAEGKSVFFIEFGSGAKYGYGHPQAAKFGYGPGTWSDSEQGEGHWQDENGWYYAHGKRSHGNPPAMAMYGTFQKLTEELTQIAKEVFSEP